MQHPIYSTSDEQKLIETIRSPEFYFSPLEFVLKMYPWGDGQLKDMAPRRWQIEYLHAIEERLKGNLTSGALRLTRLATKSGRGIGKSALQAWLCHWFLSTRFGGACPMSANSEDQLTTVLLPECGKWISMSLNGHWFERTATTISPAKWLCEMVGYGGDQWGAFAHLWSVDNLSAYAGLHNQDGMMVIYDEASGIPDVVWDVAEGFFTEKTDSRFWCVFSNPRKSSGRFYECFQPNSGWMQKTIDARSVEENDTEIYDKIIAKHGKYSYQANVEVYGNFYQGVSEGFIDPLVVNNAVNSDYRKSESDPMIMGIDPAAGGDTTGIVIRQGCEILEVIEYDSDDTTKVSAFALEVIEKWKPCAVVVDAGGLGKGVFDQLVAIQGRKNISGIFYGAKPPNPREYKTTKAYLWGKVRDWLETANIPDHARLKSDLISPKAVYDGNGVMDIEKKADLKKRGLPSPDVAESLCNTFAVLNLPLRNVSTFETPEELDAYLQRKRGARVAHWQAV